MLKIEFFSVDFFVKLLNYWLINSFGCCWVQLLLNFIVCKFNNLFGWIVLLCWFKLFGCCLDCCLALLFGWFKTMLLRFNFFGEKKSLELLLTFNHWLNLLFLIQRGKNRSFFSCRKKLARRKVYNFVNFSNLTNKPDKKKKHLFFNSL